MDEKDIVPDVMGPAAEKMDEWKSPFVTVNGILLTVEEYKKNPEVHNQKPIPPDYLSQVYLDLVSTKRSLILNIPKNSIHIKENTPKKKENP